MRLPGVLVACVAAVVPIGAAAQGGGGARPLVIGETFTITSSVLGEVRTINVYAPPAYDASPDARFPVLYMPDGGMQEDFLHIAGLVQISVLNGTMRPMLLVGIENTARRRDLTGPTRKPDLFDTYIAFDPSLWWNDGELVERAAGRIAAMPERRLYLASSSEPELAQRTKRLADALAAQAPAGIQWHYEPMPEESHATIYHPAALRAFRRLFRPPADPVAR